MLNNTFPNTFPGRTCRWVLAALLIASLGGCGGDDESKSASQSPGGNAPPSSPPSSPAPLPQPGSAMLEWTLPTTTTAGATLADLAGFRIHYGKDVQSLNNTIEVRNPSVSSYLVEDLAPGTYYFAITAFTTRNHESQRSNAGRKEII